MYTLGRVFELVNADDIYCKLYRRYRRICEGQSTDLGLNASSLIEDYRVEYDSDGYKYLILHLA